MDRTPIEAYKYATRQIADAQGRPCKLFVLAPHLLALLEHVRSTGDVPEQWCVSTLTPVFKKGDRLEHGNYRGLAVGGALAKCYALMLEHRLNAWAEGNGIRAQCQGGFRKGRGTLHNLYLARHLADRYRRGEGPEPHTPLLTCQVDFTKAFDLVPRDVLLLRLRERGVHGSMLEALARNYENVLMRVKVGGRVGVAFSSTQGVKQGDPTSPTLYGLFGEVLPDWISTKDRANPALMHTCDTPSVDGHCFSIQLYADDLTLYALSAARMQAMIGALEEFCGAFGMVVNIKKCEVLCAHPKAATRRAVANAAALRVRVWEQGAWVSSAVPVKESAPYLGLTWVPGKPYSHCASELLLKGQRATHALKRSLNTAGLLTPSIALETWNVQVRSVLSYGAQVWATDEVLRTVGTSGGPEAGVFQRALTHPMVKQQIEYLRWVAGVCTAPHHVLFRELQQLPLQVHWAELIFRWWNTIVKQKGTPCHWALRAELWAAMDSYAPSWATNVIGILNGLGYKFGDVLERVAEDTSAGMDGDDALANRLAEHTLDVEWLISTLRDSMHADWGSTRLHVPPRDFASTPGRAAPGPGVKMCRYAHWMGDPVHLPTYMSHTLRKSLMRFRMCVTALEVNRPQGRSRSERTCKVCNGGQVEDEQHVLLECTAYTNIRTRLHTLGFSSASSMAEVMTYGDQRELASIVRDMYCERERRLSIMD
ncbi:MAG: RNA-directed DNA polymerase [Limnohabitans sp.]